MPLRYLFGPVPHAHASACLPRAVAEGCCLPFDHAALRRAGSWEGLCAEAAAGKSPDLLVLHAAYLSIPAWIWETPVPVVALAPDGQLLWHAYRLTLPAAEVVLADTPAVERLHRLGLTQARPANLFGLDAALLAAADGEEPPRDLDVLFIGNLHPAVQAERLSWLGRLVRLSGRWRVHVAEGIYGADYRSLLRRARIVFNRSVRGECNPRTFEAVAAGALLFSERGNREVASFLAEGKEYVAYGDDLEDLLEHYLSHEEERKTLAEAGRARAPACTFEALWQPLLEAIEGDLPELRRRARDRPRPHGEAALLARLWQALGNRDGGDVTLASDLHAALARDPGRASLHNALGLALTLQGHGGGPTTDALAQQAAGHFRRALDSDRRHALAALNLAEALEGTGQARVAGEAARLALDALELGSGPAPGCLDEAHFPPGYDAFRVAWERVAWDHAGDPAAEVQAKEALLRGRLHALLAQLTGEATHYHEAALARPDLPAARAALGCALARAGKFAAAVAHLRVASVANPFDADAARALAQALTDAGDATGGRRVARDRRLLLTAAGPARVRPEPWFLQAPPPGDELASLVVLCCNEVNVTRLCLDSVLRHTRPPYELVLVDNGSQDATPEYLQEVARRPGPARVEVIRNEDNLGFARGCNQGLRAAHGRYLVLLNNDTVVTPAWLDRLVAWSLHDWPKIGLVGPVTNCAPAPQGIAVASNDRLDGLDDFARARTREFAGQALAVERLTGFCLLVRREVLDAVGTLDEQFGVGFFEDDDLCLRARQAGFGLLVARDTFIHHFGSRTFRALGLNAEALLTDNFARFRAKWGAERTRGYGLPGQPAGTPPPAVASLPVEKLFPPYAGKKSLTLIVKNEEHNIADCLSPLLDLFDEIIVQDTGSTDRTRAVAAALGPKVKVFEGGWNDSFAEARNRALAHASGDWILWVDADDRLDAANRDKLRTLLAGLKNDNAAYALKCVCLPDPVTGATTVVDHVRLFRNHPALRWEYRVHEQILPSVRRLGGEVRFADVAVLHTGYQDPALRRRKLERDLRLLEKNLAEKPDEPFCLFNLGCIYQDLGRFPEALEALRQSLARSAPSDSIVRKLYGLIAGCHQALGQRLEALKACDEGLRVCPDDAELLYRRGVLLTDLGNYPEAEAVLLRLLGTASGQHFASVDAGLRGYLGRHRLAIVCHRRGQHEAALAQWRLVVQEQPGFLPGWLGLAENALARRDYAALEEAAQKLDGLPGGPLEAGLLRAQGLLARPDVAAARTLAEAVVAAHPGDVAPKLFLASLLLNAARDLDAAEAVLRQALVQAPAHPEVQRALAALLRQKHGSETAVFVARGDVGAWALLERYRAACVTPSDINEHLPTLHELARGCRHITEMGTRTGTSTLALLAAQPDRLVCLDVIRYPEVDQLAALAGRTEFVFRREDTLRADIEETDLLFIDTFHAYEQLREELQRHAAKARRYIVLHDTTTFGDKGEQEGSRGMWPAVEEFLAEGSFRVKQRFENNNGLTILERI